MHRKRQQSPKKFGKIPIYLLAALLVAAIVLLVLEKANITSIFTSAKSTQGNEPQTTSVSPSAQTNFNGGDAARENKDPGNTLRENSGSAVIIDNNGVAPTNTGESMVSSSGEITVFLPHAGSTLSTKQEVSGKSTLSTVHYRLIDNISGVIATGQLQVINGNFSGTLSFETSATEGRLDIFGAKPDASEYSNIEIPVRFK